MRTKTIQISEELLRRNVHTLISRSMWFQLEPLPDGMWDLTVKEEVSDTFLRTIGPVEPPKTKKEWIERAEVVPYTGRIKKPIYVVYCDFDPVTNRWKTRIFCGRTTKKNAIDWAYTAWKDKENWKDTHFYPFVQEGIFQMDISYREPKTI